jgi:hypothetical protein
MRFIELEPGVSVKAEDISVIKDSRSGSTVYTQAGAFESIIPRAQLMMILSKHEDRMDSIQKTLANLSKNS